MFSQHRIGISTLSGLALAALIAGCGGSAPAAPTAAAGSVAAQPTAVGGSTPPAAAQTNDAAPTSGTADGGRACTIFTTDAVATAVGFAIDGTSGVDTICYYQNADVSRFLVVTLFDNQADMALMLQIEPGSDHIAGLGDDAFWVPISGILFVRVGDHGIELIDQEASLATNGGSQLKDALVTLVRTGLPKL